MESVGTLGQQGIVTIMTDTTKVTKIYILICYDRNVCSVVLRHSDNLLITHIYDCLGSNNKIW